MQDYESEQDDLYYIGSILRSKHLEEPTVMSDSGIAMADDTDPNHPNPNPEEDTHGQSFISKALSGTSSVGSDVGKAFVKGVPKGAEETLYGAAELVGAPVDFVNFIASKVPGVGQYISSDMPMGGSDSIKYVLDAYNNFVNDNIPGVETANTWAENLEYDNQMLGGISEGLAQFSVAAVPAATMVKALTSANALVRGLYWGAIADYAAFNPNDETLTVMLTKMWDGATPEERTKLGNTVIAIMEKNTDDPEIINRAKAMLEGGILGLASEGLIKVLVEGAKYVPWKKATGATVGGAAMNMQNPSDAEAGFLTSAVKGALKSGDNVASDVVEDTVNTSRRGFLKGIIATPIAISANNINKIIPEGIISKAAPNIGDGISNLSKLLSNGIFPDKQTLSAVASSIDNKILDLRDEGLGNSPDSEDLQTVLDDLEKLEKANVYPAKIDYFSNLSKDLYDTQVEDVIENIKFDINTEPDMRVYTELDPMDYTKDIAGLKIEDIENLKDSTIPVNPDMGEPKGVLTSSDNVVDNEVVEDRMDSFSHQIRINNSFDKIKQDLESNLGVTFENIHSHPTSAGYSKYFDVSKIDPESGEKLTKTIRFSDHLTGDVRAVNERQVFSEKDLSKLINKTFDEENFKKNINLQIENKTKKIEKEAQEKRTKNEIKFFNNNLKKEERNKYIYLAMQELGIGLTKGGNFKPEAITRARELYFKDKNKD